MLKKQNRLKSRSAFSATYNNNHSEADNSIVLYIGHEKNEKNCPTRVGFVVSKKIHKRAVVRNKIKRLIRENVRLMIKNNDFPMRYQSVIFVARNSILNKSYNQIRQEIEKIINKIAKYNI